MAVEPVKSDAPPSWGRVKRRDFVDVTTDKIVDLANRFVCMRLVPLNKKDSDYPGFHPDIVYCVRDLSYTMEFYRRGAYGKHGHARLYKFPKGLEDPPDWDTFRTRASDWMYKEKDSEYTVSGIRPIRAPRP